MRSTELPVYPFDRNAPPLFDAAHLCTAYGAMSYKVYVMEINGRISLHAHRKETISYIWLFLRKLSALPLGCDPRYNDCVLFKTKLQSFHTEK